MEIFYFSNSFYNIKTTNIMLKSKLFLLFKLSVEKWNEKMCFSAEIFEIHVYEWSSKAQGFKNICYQEINLSSKNFLNILLIFRRFIQSTGRIKERPTHLSLSVHLPARPCAWGQARGHSLFSLARQQ